MKVIDTEERLYKDIKANILQVDKFPTMKSFRIEYEKITTEMKETSTKYGEIIEINGHKKKVYYKENVKNEVVNISKSIKACNIKEEEYLSLGLRSIYEAINLSWRLEDMVLNKEEI